MALALPEGKDYHLFFSHSSKDYEWVRNTIELMEAPPYNLKCCYSEKDFNPGQTIVANIEHAVEKSMCTCLVLSPDFIQSEYCKYELDLAHTFSIEGGCKIIPVMLKQCEVPPNIRFMNYVEPERLDVNVYDKIQDALLTDGKEFQRLAFPLIENGLRKVSEIFQENGFPITIALRDGRFTWSETVEAMLADMGGKMVPGVTSAILRFATKQMPIKTRRCWSWPGSILFILWIYGASFVLFATMIQIEGGPFVPFGISISVALLVGPFLFGITFRMRNKGCELFKINCKSMTLQQVFYGLIVEGFKSPKLRIVKYDGNKCLKYLEEMMGGENATVATDVSPNKAIDRLIPMYSKELVYDTLPLSTVIRHKVKNNKICLCQYVETHMLRKTLWQQLQDWKDLRYNSSRVRHDDLEILIDT